jgi:hypothetical protein
MAALAEEGITRGCNPPDNSRFCPDEVVTRGQMAAFMARGGELGSVPAVPPGVTFGRAQLDNGATEVTVCPGAGDVEVRTAAWGSMIGEVSAGAELTEVTLTTGTYDEAADVWTVPVAYGCSSLHANWRLGHPTFFLPSQDFVITSGFEMRTHPTGGGRRLHAGTDFAVPTGTPVSTASEGIVKATRRSGSGYTKEVLVSHRTGSPPDMPIFRRSM